MEFKEEYSLVFLPKGRIWTEIVREEGRMYLRV
jgi:hypothetical protein